jgi:tetratricopeptide (TPR) repeat protein
MSAQRTLDWLFALLMRRTPRWMRSRRAAIAALAGVGVITAGAVADVGEVFDMVIPGRAAATSAEIAALKSDLLKELRAQGITIDATAQSEIGKALAYFDKVKDKRVENAKKLMKTAPPAEALALFKAVTETIAQKRRGRDAAQAWAALGALAYPVDSDLAISSYERARELDPDDADAHFSLASLYQDHARLDEARAEYDKARDLARAEGDPNLAALAAMNNGLISKQQGFLDESEAALLGAVKSFQDLGDAYNLAVAYLNLGALYAVKASLNSTGEFNPDASEHYYVQAMDIAYGLNDPDLVASANLGLGDVWRARGSYIQAVEHYGRAIAHFEWMNSPDQIAQTHLKLGYVALELNDSQTASMHFDEAFRIYAALKQPLGVASAKFAIGALHGARNDVAGACREIGEARDIFAAAGAGSGVYIEQIDRLRASLCAGPPSPDAVARPWEALDPYDIWDLTVPQTIANPDAAVEAPLALPVGDQAPAPGDHP